MGLLTLLSGCNGSVNTPSGLTPMPSDTKSPNDEKMKETITTYLTKRGAPPNSTYQYKRIDLNNDRILDAIVLFKLPHTYWCGWDGCGMLILKANSKTLTPFSTVIGVRGPIYVRDTGKNGWRDIIVRISGARMADKNIVLSNTGRGYPASPMLATDLDVSLGSINADKLFR